MFKFFLLLLCAVPLFASAQALKKVSFIDKSSGNEEVYYVLKKEPSVKQGRYIKTNSSGGLIQTGNFKKGLKDGLWVEYFPQNGAKFSQGFYTHGEISGIWEYYNPRGDTDQRFDYDSHRMLYVNNYNQKPKAPKIPGLDSLQALGAQRAVYIGGDEAFMRQLIRLMSYPRHARDNNIQGKVIVKFIIDEQGKTNSYQVLRSVDPELDQEAIRVIKLLDNNWYPAQLNGKAVASEYFVPIQFKLQ